MVLTHLLKAFFNKSKLKQFILKCTVQKIEISKPTHNFKANCCLNVHNAALTGPISERDDRHVQKKIVAEAEYHLQRQQL